MKWKIWYIPISRSQPATVFASWLLSWRALWSTTNAVTDMLPWTPSCSNFWQRYAKHIESAPPLTARPAKILVLRAMYCIPPGIEGRSYRSCAAIGWGHFDLYGHSEVCPGRQAMLVENARQKELGWWFSTWRQVGWNSQLMRSKGRPVGFPNHVIYIAFSYLGNHI